MQTPRFLHKQRPRPGLPGTHTEGGPARNVTDAKGPAPTATSYGENCGIKWTVPF